MQHTALPEAISAHSPHTAREARHRPQRLSASRRTHSPRPLSRSGRRHGRLPGVLDLPSGSSLPFLSPSITIFDYSLVSSAFYKSFPKRSFLVFSLISFFFVLLLSTNTHLFTFIHFCLNYKKTGYSSFKRCTPDKLNDGIKHHRSRYHVLRRIVFWRTLQDDQVLQPLSGSSIEIGYHIRQRYIFHSTIL